MELIPQRRDRSRKQSKSQEIELYECTDICAILKHQERMEYPIGLLGKL